MTNVRSLSAIAIALFLVGSSACSDGGGGGAGAPATGGMGGTTGGSGGAGGTTGGMGGAAGMNPAAGMGGMGGMTGGTGGVTGGSGGMTGGMGGMTGGMGGMTGGMGGMTGGMGGMGGGGGDLEAWHRGEAPTASSVMANGPYTVMEITEADGLRNGDAYGDAGGAAGGATVYYPADADPPFGGVAIVPGFLYTRDEMAGWGPFLASHGIVVINIDPNTTGDQPAVRSPALLDALESLKAENTREGSPLKDKLATDRMGVMGWSMGGGGTWLTADDHPELKVAISLCGWIIGAPGSTTTVASLQLASLGDPLADQMSQPVHEAIPAGTPKMLIEFSGGDHYIGNDPSFASGQIGKYGLSWIKVYLEGDERYMQFLESEPTGTTDVRRSL